ncbi:MAG: aspartate-semialdehyde dehydrogenase, partial [Gammaproteobacteria bacterium]|nr:aspartate-semialdehyde dehydrogenase [Gammaproteobacteria bacterium]
MSKKYAVAVVGATGLVGEAMRQVLEEREFPVGRFVPLASARSAGRSVTFRGTEHVVEALDDFDFSGIDIALFSAGASVSAEAAPRAAAAGAVVIDNTSQ